MTSPLTTNKTPLILLVEDNIIALRLIETIVDQAGCRHISATNGEFALELIKTTDFDLIITDIGLPGMSGTEFTVLVREWKSANNQPQIPIIGLTAHTLQESEVRCLEAGMNKVLSKPIYLDEVQELVFQFIKSNTLKQFTALSDTQTGLEKIPLFDYAEAMKNIGSKTILIDLLKLMVKEAIPEDRASVEKAYQKQDWQLIEELAHKMKSGAIYCGAKRMQHICHSIERLQKNNNPVLLEQLYQQLLQVLRETKDFLQEWLIKSKA
ncbi:MAG: response regulator [Tatlockia sp.]|nr:response regulator [Tatlockia sp.]